MTPSEQDPPDRDRDDCRDPEDLDAELTDEVARIERELDEELNEELGEPTVEYEIPGLDDDPDEGGGTAEVEPEQTEPVAAAPAAEPEGEARVSGREPAAAPEDQAEPQPVREPVVAASAQPAASASDEKPGRATRLWPRFFAASFAIVASLAAATAISALVFLDNIADGFGGIEKVQGKLASVEGGDPQTILVLGSDKRPGDGVQGRSDTTMLVRVDPDSGAIALLSIPRDLKVDIPGHGEDKFNAAYSIGGPALTLKLVKELTKLDINHVINIDFTGFADAVNAIDCVYLDVDRHYFNDNSLAASTLEQYAEIDIEAGYQRLCGYNALQYVRYRHEDTDLVRSARQQDFLREARQKIEPKKLVFNADYRNGLVDVFKKYTTSDDALKDPIEVLSLMKTFIAARDAPVREVHFPAQLGGPSDPYVTAENDAIAAAVDQFYGTEGTPGPSPTGEADKPDEGNGDGGKGDKDEPDKKPDARPEDAEGLIGAADSGELYARQIARHEAQGRRSDGRLPDLLSDPPARRLVAQRRLACVRHRWARRRGLPRLQDRRRVSRARRFHRVLRLLRHRLARRPDPREPERGADDRRP